MNKVHTSAGVYTKIRDFSSAPTVSTGLRIGMVGAMERGPVNMRFRTIDINDWKRFYGKRNHAKYGYAGAIADEAHKVSNQLHNVRLAPEAEYAVVHLTVDDPKAQSPKIYMSAHTNAQGEPVGIKDPAELGWLPTDPVRLTELGAFYQANPGSWSVGSRIFVLPNNPRGLDPIKNRDEYNTAQFVVQYYESYVAGAMPDESFVVTFDDYQDSDGKQYNIEDVLESQSANLRFKRNTYCQAVPVVRSANCDMVGGTDGRLPTSAEIAEAYREFFADPEDLSCHIIVNAMGFDHVVHRAMDAVAQRHDNCRALLQVPLDRTSVRLATDYRDNILNLDTYYSFLYYDVSLVFDEEEGRKYNLPLVAYAIGAYSAANFVRAPAGIDMSQHIRPLGVRHILTQPERNVLTNSQINYLRKLPDEIGGSFALWEQRTLYRRNSSLRNINVSSVSGRVLEIVSRRAKYGLFDPNDRLLRTELRTMARQELQPMAVAGAFNTVNGATPFEVICDESNNPNTAIANGDLILDVVIDPANSVRRIIIRYNINKKGSRLTEITS